jgi:predicted RNA-binding protein YlxR (DUF448 family)
VPQRTCIACRKTTGKRELVRLVRTPAGIIEVDREGKKEGRGAYLCADPACWEKALKGKQIEHNLRCNLTQQDRDRLLGYGRELLKGVE